jgi:hypothetical protein
MVQVLLLEALGFGIRENRCASVAGIRGKVGACRSGALSARARIGTYRSHRRKSDADGYAACLEMNFIFLSVALCANSQRDIPASFIIGEEEQDIDIDHLMAASFAEMNREGTGRDSVEKSFNFDFQTSLAASWTLSMLTSSLPARPIRRFLWAAITVPHAGLFSG